jgi:hypothetical protein
MTHGRKYGEKESRPVPIWNGIFEHYGRIGDALWEFEKCIDWITEERDGVGIVLGGKPIKVSAIVAAIKGSKKETVRRHMDTLEREKFIRRRRTPYGHVIEVLNSRKFGIWKKEKPQNDVSLTEEKPIHGSEKPTGGSEKPKNSINKEDAAVTQHKDAAVTRLGSSPLWSLIGVNAEGLPKPFVELCEGLHARKNGQSLAEFVGACMDGWEALGNKKQPRGFVQAANRIREKAKNPPPAPVEFLPAMPFQTKKVGQCQTKN